MSKSQEMAEEIAALLRARNPLIWLCTREEARVERYLFEAAASAGYIARCWDVGQGVTGMDGKPVSLGSPDPGATLATIDDRSRNGSERGVWIMRDLPPWMQGTIGIATVRQVRNLARNLPMAVRDRAQAIIVISPDGSVPPELTNHATVIEWPLPDREEVARIVDAAIEVLPEEMKVSAAPNGTRDAAIDATVGLSGEEAAACYARSLVQLRRIDPVTVAKEKKRIVARERVLEWFDPIPGGLEAVGGLDVLKSWLVSRKSAYSAKARAYGLPAPRGALLVGIPGCGKSLTAKAVATAWGVPLLRLDLGSLKSKFVGDSEGNLRRALRTIEAIGRCVVWLDEIEKGLAGATQGAADGGVSADALGTILSWMQDRAGEAFVMATANDVSSLPPELMRKGRFDEIWWIDLPNKSERLEIVKTALRSYGRAEVEIDHATVARACDTFTGSEIAAIVPDALFAAFADGEREITTADLLNAAATVVPMCKTSSEKIERLRSWATGRARSATTLESAVTSTGPALRQIDL